MSAFQIPAVVSLQGWGEWKRAEGIACRRNCFLLQSQHWSVAWLLSSPESSAPSPFDRSFRFPHLANFSFISKSSDTSRWSNMTRSHVHHFPQRWIMQPAGCKTAIWFIYHQEALANQVRYTLIVARMWLCWHPHGKPNHSRRKVVTWLDGRETRF